MQVLFNSLIRAAELGLLAVGLTMVYDLLKFANFSHVSFATVGAYLALVLSTSAGLGIYLAAAIAIPVVGILGVVLDKTVFKRLRGASPVILMITSFGVSLALRNVIRAIWGSDIRSFDIPLYRGINILGGMITPIQIGIIAVAVVVMFLFHLLLHRTRLGKSMRATSDNVSLAQASGIQTEKVIQVVWFIGTAFAALAGILIGLDTQIQPRMGFDIIIPVFSATILGGLGNPYGAMLGALALGFAENIGITWLQIPTGYKPAIAFGMLIFILLIRPSGIMGKKEI